MVLSGFCIQSPHYNTPPDRHLLDAIFLIRPILVPSNLMADLAAPVAARETPPATQLLVMIGSGGPSYTKCNIYIVSSAGTSLSQLLFGTKCVAVSVAAVNDLPLHTKGSVCRYKALPFILNVFVGYCHRSRADAMLVCPHNSV